MIWTVTLNPAIDCVVRLEHFHSGGMNRALEQEVEPGGKGINVSRILQQLGVESTALGFVAGFTGLALEEALRQMGIATRFVSLPAGATRINLKIRAETESEVNGSGPEVPRWALEQLLDGLDALGPGDALVLSGSAPPSVPKDICRQALERVAGRDVWTVVDAEGELLRQALPCRPFLVKPNRRELGEFFGEQPDSDGEILDCARRMQEMGARNVLVSLARQGSLLLDGHGRSHRMGAPQGEVVSSVGAGDSMVAGFLAGWLETGQMEAAQRLGTAAGAATAFCAGLAQRSGILAQLDRF